MSLEIFHIVVLGLSATWTELLILLHCTQVVCRNLPEHVAHWSSSTNNLPVWMIEALLRRKVVAQTSRGALHKTLQNFHVYASVKMFAPKSTVNDSPSARSTALPLSHQLMSGSAGEVGVSL